MPPDFVSVNLGEVGWAAIVRAALHADIGVEVGLASPDDANAFARSSLAHRVAGAVEVDGAVEEARRSLNSYPRELCSSGTATASAPGR